MIFSTAGELKCAGGYRRTNFHRHVAFSSDRQRFSPRAGKRPVS